MSTLLTVVGEIWSQMGTLVTRISDNPLLLIGLAFTFAFSTVSLAKKLMGIRRRG